MQILKSFCQREIEPGKEENAPSRQLIRWVGAERTGYRCEHVVVYVG